MSKLGNIFKNKLPQRNYNPPPGDWENLSKRLDEHDRLGKRNFAKWISGIALTMLVIGIYFIIPVDNNKAKIVSHEKEVESQGPEIKPETVLDDSEIRNNSQNKSGNTKKNKTLYSVNDQRPLKESPSTQVKIKESRGSESPFVKSDDLANMVKEEKTVTEHKIDSKEKDIRIESVNNEITTESNEEETEPTNLSSKNANSDFENQFRLIESIDTNSTIAAAGKTQVEKAIETSEISESKYDSVAIKIIETPVLSDTTDSDSRFELYISAGPSFHEKIITTTFNDAGEWLLRRKKEEMPLTGFNVSLGGTFWLNDKFTLSTELNYRQIHESLEYEPFSNQWNQLNNSYWNIDNNSYWNSYQVENWDTTMSWAYKPSDSLYTITFNNNTGFWDTTLIYTDSAYFATVDSSLWYSTDSTYMAQFDSTWVENYDSISVSVLDSSVSAQNGKMSISYVEIPLMFGYKFGNEKFGIHTRVGLGVGKLTARSLYYLKTDNSELVQYDKLLFSKWLYNLHARVALEHNRGKQWTFMLEPGFSMNLNSYFKDDYFKEKFVLYNLNAGVKYRF